MILFFQAISLRVFESVLLFCILNIHTIKFLFRSERGIQSQNDTRNTIDTTVEDPEILEMSEQEGPVIQDFSEIPEIQDLSEISEMQDMSELAEDQVQNEVCNPDVTQFPSQITFLFSSLGNYSLVRVSQLRVKLVWLS